MGKVYRYRIRLRRFGPARYSSHLDFIRAVTRATRRAQLPVAFSQGYRPTPRLSFGPPLPLGAESEAEYIDLICRELLAEEEIKKRLQHKLPPGLEVMKARKISIKTPSLSAAINLLTYTMLLRSDPGWIESELQLFLADLWARKELPVTRERKGRSKTVDLRPLWKKYGLRAQGEGLYLMEMETVFGPQGTMRPDDLELCLPEGFTIFKITRTGAWIVTASGRMAPISD